MPRGALPDELLPILQKPNPSVLGTVRPDGQAVTFPVWYDLESPHILLNMTNSRKALRYVLDERRVSLTVMDKDDWYTHISMQGTIVDIRDDSSLTDIDRISRRYRGVEYVWRIPNRLSLLFEVERWHGWGAAELKPEDD